MYKDRTGSNDKQKRSFRSIPIGHMLKCRGEKTATLNQKLNEELIFSYERLKMSEEEVNCRREAFEKLKSLLEKELNCRVESHGSFRTGTMVYGSDIDLTVLMKNEIKSDINYEKSDINYKGDSNRTLSRIVTILEQAKVCVGPVLHIRNARIPIIKCTERLFNSKVDIVIDQYDSIKGANFVIDQLDQRPYLKYMIILVKYFFKRRQLSEVVRGGLCSYGQFLMILNFVQLHPLIQSEEFNEINFTDNIGTVLMDFFQFYGTEFPFEKATISVLETRYKPNRQTQINIEDPINLGHNVASGCTSLHTIRELFTYSYKLMAAAFCDRVDTKRAIGELWLRLDEKEMIQRKNNKDQKPTGKSNKSSKSNPIVIEEVKVIANDENSNDAFNSSGATKHYKKSGKKTNNSKK